MPAPPTAAVCFILVAESYQLSSYGHGVFGGQAQIVGDEPEPAGLGMVTVRGDGADRDAALACLAEVGGRVEIRAPHLNGAHGQAAFERLHSGIDFELDPCGEAVTMKHGRLDEPQ